MLREGEDRKVLFKVPEPTARDILGTEIHEAVLFLFLKNLSTGNFYIFFSYFLIFVQPSTKLVNANRISSEAV